MEKEAKTYKMNVAIEFKQLCDDFSKKIKDVTWNAVDYSYPEITRILTRKLRELKVLDK